MRQPSKCQKDLRKARPKLVCVVSSFPRVMDGWRIPVALLIRVSYVRLRRTSYTCIDIHYTYLSVTNGSEIHQYILKRIFFFPVRFCETHGH